MEHISKALSTIVQAINLKRHLDIEDLRVRWCDYFNEPVSLHTYAAALSEGVLTVYTDSPVWMQQLTYYKNDFLAKLSDYQIKNIKFKLGKVHQCDNKSFRQTSTYTPLSPTKQQFINETLEIIKNEEIKVALQHLMQKALMHERR